MLKQKKSAILIALVAVAFLLIALSLRYLPTGDNVLLAVAKTALRNVIHLLLLTMWCISLHRRLMDERIRRILMITGGLMIFWLIAKTVKYEYMTAFTDHVGRYMWYCFWIPMLLIPLFGMYTVHYIGKPEGYRLPGWMKALLIPAFLLIGLVMTNDMHQLVFRFYQGIANYDKHYSYGFPYYILMAWYILFSLHFAAALLRKCRVPGNRKIQTLPLVIAICSVAFWIIYVLKLVKVDLTVIDCLIIVSLLESAIQCGMIPSNTDYQQIFHVTTMPIHVVDYDFEPHYVSAGAIPVSQEQLRQGADTPLALGDWLLSGAPISAGWVFWQDDIRKIRELQERLQDAQEQLNEEGTLIQAETKVKQMQAIADEQNRLYDRIARDVELQLIKMDTLLDRIEREPENVRMILAKICVIGSYVKRRGNLLLLEEENDRVNASELEYCLRESLENLRLGGAYTSLAGDCAGRVPLENVVATYDFYETFVERLLDDVTAMMIHLSVKNGRIRMNMQVGCKETIAQQVLTDAVPDCGRFSYEIMEEDVMIDWTLEEEV